MTMRVALFGTYAKGTGYPRARVLLEALSKAGVTVDEIHADLGLSVSGRVRGASTMFRSIGLLCRILLALVRLCRRYKCAARCDVLVVGPTGYFDVLLARRLVGARRDASPVIVFDPFFSLTETLIEDRALVDPRSLRARLLRRLERGAVRAADALIADTWEHAAFFSETFGVPRSRIGRVLVGQTDGTKTVQRRCDVGDDTLRVLYVGTFVPLHGLETVVRAAALLEGHDIEIQLVGDGQDLPKILALAIETAPGVVRIVQGWRTGEDLTRLYEQSDVCLGVFGDGKKAARVIPCKVYDALARGMAVVTADTGASREVLTSDRNALLTPPADAKALAKALLRLKRDPHLLEKLRRGALELVRGDLSLESIGSDLREFLEGIVAGVDGAAPAIPLEFVGSNVGSQSSKDELEEGPSTDRRELVS